MGLVLQALARRHSLTFCVSQVHGELDQWPLQTLSCKDMSAKFCERAGSSLPSLCSLRGCMLPPIVYAFFGTCLAPGAFELVLQLSLPPGVS